MGASVRAAGEGLERIRKLAAELKAKPAVRVGVLGDGGNNDELTNAELAAIHEYGAPRANIPERSFLRATADAKRQEWLALMERGLRLAVAGRLSVKASLSLVGEQAVADIRTRIRSHIPPPLQPATVARKGSSVPLVDTSRLLMSIAYEVKEGA